MARPIEHAVVDETTLRRPAHLIAAAIGFDGVPICLMVMSTTSPARPLSPHGKFRRLLATFAALVIYSSYIASRRRTTPTANPPYDPLVRLMSFTIFGSLKSLCHQ